MAQLFMFSVIWFLSSLAQIIAEYYRIKSDKKTNSRIYKKIVDGEEVDIVCSAIGVGDILRIYDDEEIPADCILLSSYELMAH